MALVIPGSRNGFLINLTPQVVGYVRKPDKFRLNRYCEWVRSKNIDGAYTRIGRDQMVRVDNTNRGLWRDGADRPKGTWNKLPFEHISFHTERYHEPWELGYQALDNFEAFDLKLAHMDMVASQSITRTTLRFLNLMTTSSNWGGVHVKSASQLSGVGSGNQFWHKASADETNPSFNVIEKTLSAALREINLDTNAVVEPEQMRMVINPNTARRIKESGEWTAYMKGSPDAYPLLKDPGNMNKLWGLTEKYKGLVEIVIENAMYVSEKANTDQSEATTNRQFCMPDNTALILTQVGSIDGVYGAPSFTTGQIFYYPKPIKAGDIRDGEGGQMVMSARPDDDNEKIVGGATCQTAEVLASPVSGYLITNLFS